MPAYLIAALLTGAIVSFQTSANSALSKAAGNPLLATGFSLCISLGIVAALATVLKIRLPDSSNFAGQPYWIWFGGVASVIYLTSANFLTPQLGATAFLAALVAGQMAGSAAIDNFGLMGLPVRPVTIPRLIGVVLVVVGAALVQGPDLWRSLFPGNGT